MRALVTGSSGFLGRHLCKALKERGHFVVGMVRDDIRNVGKQYGDVIVYGDILSAPIEREIAEYEIDTVFHLAAQTQVSTAVNDPNGTLETNVRGTWRVLEACRRQKVKSVVVASSDKAYGDGPTPYDEDQGLKPCGIYATSKACADMIAQAYADEYKMPVVVTRCGNLYGPGHLNWSTLIPGTIRSILKGERPRLRSDGGPKRDYLYVADAVDAYIRIGACEGSGMINLGTGVGSSVIDVVDEILLQMVSDLRPMIEVSDGPIEIEEQVLDCSWARHEIGWQAYHSLSMGLKKTIEWYRKYFEESTMRLEVRV